MITENGDTRRVKPSGTQLSHPDGIYVDKQGNVFITNQRSGNLIKVDPSGVATIFAALGNRPKGITADEDGNLYVSHNHESGRISKITPDGQVTTLASIPTYKDEAYILEYLMWVGYLTYHEGFLYVAGMSTDRIYQVSLAGEVKVFAGSGQRGVPRGDASRANLNRPLGLAFSEDGQTLYISGCTDNTPSHTQYTTPGKVWKMELVD